MAITTFAAPLILIALFLISGFKIVQEYERGVIFRWGRLVGERGPGLIYVIPLVERMIKVDLRIVSLDVPSQEIITKDNVPARVNAVIYFRVISSQDSVVKVENYFASTSLIAQTTLRSILGQSELDELLAERDKINQKLQRTIDEQTDPWGIKVTAVEVKDLELPEAMKRAMAKQAEAERERRAKVINAEGELQAATKLTEAAKIMGEHPMTLQLRFLQTVREATAEKASTFVIPLPIDIIKPLMEKAKEK